MPSQRSGAAARLCVDRVECVRLQQDPFERAERTHRKGNVGIQGGVSDRSRSTRATRATRATIVDSVRAWSDVINRSAVRPNSDLLPLASHSCEGSDHVHQRVLS